MPDAPTTRPRQTLDEELLLWLGDEPPEVRAADTERIQRIAALGMQILGPRGVDEDEEFGWLYLRSRFTTIGGGTSEITRNQVAERVLGLPGDIRVDKDVLFKDLPAGQRGKGATQSQ